MDNQRALQRTVDRRALMGYAASGILALASPRVSASEMTVPQVDALTLQILVDNATFGPFLPDLSLPGMEVNRSNGGTQGGVMGRHPLLAEFGLSVLAESRRGEDTRHVLIDSGYSPDVISNNLKILGIDPAQIDAAVLSHGHLDHYGGFAGVFGPSARTMKPVPLFVGGEEAFCERVALVGDPPPLMGTLDRTALRKAGFDTIIAPDPQILAGHGFTTGRIPLTSFERAAIPTQMRPGVGCAVAALPKAKRKAHQIADDGDHELATCYVVSTLGLVVIASCSHRGILNSIRQAQAISGIDKVHAIIGGFHLVRPRTEEEAKRTVAELAVIDPDYIIPMHCTGEVFIAEAVRTMPQKVVRPYVGTKLTFGQRMQA